MKKREYRFLVYLLGFILFCGCQEAEVLVPTTGNELGGIRIITPDGLVFTGAPTGNPQDTIFVEVEGKRALDLTKLTMSVGIPNNATVDPPLGTYQDFSKPFNFTVTGADGNKAVYTVKVIHVPVAFTIDELWKKTGTELGFTKHNNGAVAISGEYVVVHDRARFKYYNISDGNEVDTLSWQGIDLSPFPLHLTSDDAGNLVSCNFAGAAGTELRMYCWEGVKAEPKLLFKWASDAADNVGRKLYVKGDINKLAYIYAGVSKNNLFLRWEMKNGVVTSEIPDKISFNNPNGTWGVQAKIVPVEIGKNTNYFVSTNAEVRITYMDGVSNEPLYNSAKFGWLEYGHAFDYLDLSGAKFIFQVELNKWNWMSEVLTVRKLIKDPSSITSHDALIQTHTRVWDDWLKFPLDPNLGENGNGTADVKAQISEDGLSAIVAFLCTNAGVKVWRVNLE